MNREQMIEDLEKGVENWDNETLLIYAKKAYRNYFEALATQELINAYIFVQEKRLDGPKGKVKYS